MCALQIALPIQRGCTIFSRQDIFVSTTDRAPRKLKLSAADFRRSPLSFQHVGVNVAFLRGNQTLNRAKGLSPQRLVARASSESPKQPSDNQPQNSSFRSRDGEDSQAGRDVGGISESGFGFNRQDGSEKEQQDRAKKGGRDANAGASFKEPKRTHDQSTVLSENIATSRGNGQTRNTGGKDSSEADGDVFRARVSEGGNGLAGGRDVGVEIRGPDSVDGTRRQDVYSKQAVGVEGKGTEYSAAEDDPKINVAIAGAAGLLWEKLKNNPVVHLFAQWPAWQQKKRLERLQAIADANPKDASKQAALLSELYKSRFVGKSVGSI